MAQIASFDELKKEQRPPEIYWDNPKELERWFDRVFDSRTDSNKSGNLEFYIDEDEIE